MVNDETVLLQWCFTQPEFKSIIETTLTEKSIKMFDNIKLISGKEIGECFCNLVEGRFRKLHRCSEVENFLSSKYSENELLKIIIDNRGKTVKILLPDNRLKMLGNFIKTTDWWAANKKELGKTARANKAVNQIMTT